MVTVNLGMLHYVLDHVYGAFMHRTKISPQFFSRGWGGSKLELLERMIKQLFPEAAGQNWPPAVIQPTWKTVWESKTASLREGIFRTPCDEQLLGALPPESHRARVAFLVPKSVPPQRMACVVHLAALSDGPEQIISKDRKYWLKKFVTRKIWSSREVVDTLTQITSLRDSIIYFPYCLIDRSLPPDPLLKSIFALDLDLQFSTESSLPVADSRTEGSEEDDGGEDEESGQSDTNSDLNYSPAMASPPSDIPPSRCVTSPPRDLPVPRVAGRSDKRPLVDRPKKSRRGSPTIFGVAPRSMLWQSAPPTFGSASGDGSSNSSQAWRPEFTKRDGSHITLGDDLWDNATAATAVARGLVHPSDAGRFEAMPDDDVDSCESHCLIKMALLQREKSDRLAARLESLSLTQQQVREYRAKLHGYEEEITNLQGARDAATSEVCRAKEELAEVKRARATEREMNTQQIRKEMASSFRFGWVQSQQRPEHRFVVDPDAYDRHMGIEPGGYEWYEGMDPKDRKPSDQPASSDPIPGSGFVTTSGPISSLGFGGFQSGPHFGVQ